MLLIVIPPEQNSFHVYLGGRVADWPARQNRRFETRFGHLRDLLSVVPSSKPTLRIHAVPVKYNE